MEEPTNRMKAFSDAAGIAVEKLSSVDVAGRCRILELPPPDSDGTVTIGAFGHRLSLTPPEFNAVTESGDKADAVERILALHYLLCEIHVVPSGEIISFAELPGGQFYLGPYSKRTVSQLVRYFGNDVGLLRERAGRLDYEPVDIGDFGALINVIGKLKFLLVYRAGDDEFPPSADILFDSSIKKVFCNEDAAAAAGRLCSILMKD
jgi:hypothetical protein